MSDATERLITLRDKVQLAFAEANELVEDDNAEWERRGMAGEAQDSEEAENSGILIGKKEAFAEMLELVITELVIAERGGLPDERGTYINPARVTPTGPGHVTGVQDEPVTLGGRQWAIPMGGQVGLDTTSSASRQHYIDTGRYLRVGEADEA